MPEPSGDPLLPLPLDAELRGQCRVRCRGCGRPLTGSVARLRGWGDDCWAKLAERTAPRPGRFTVEQDQLPGA